MIRRRRGRGGREAPELDITAFMNLMVILVPFLLISAVFSRLAVVDLALPGSGGSPAKPSVSPVVTLTAEALVVRAPGVRWRLPHVQGRPDRAGLRARLLEFKADHPEARTAVLQVAEAIDYATLVSVMDAIRFAPDEEGRPAALFPDVSLGDARP